MTWKTLQDAKVMRAAALSARDGASEPLFEARLAEQFDAVIHFDERRALEPLGRTSERDRGELPETYPSSL